MSMESRLREAAVRATDDDTVVDVAEFHPRGTALASAAGAAAGSVAGGDSNWGSALGAGVGIEAGKTIRAATSDLPRLICVAVSPTETYLLGVPVGPLSQKLDAMYPIAKIDRDRLGVEVHQRASVRVVILEDLATNVRFEVEAPRLNHYHAKALIELLMMSDEHHDPVPADLAEA